MHSFPRTHQSFLTSPRLQNQSITLYTKCYTRAHLNSNSSRELSGGVLKKDVHDWALPAVRQVRQRTNTTDTLKAEQKVHMAGGCTESVPKSCSPKSHRFVSFIHKNHTPVNTFQLGRTVNKKQNYRNQKASSGHLGTFLVLWTKSSMD